MQPKTRPYAAQEHIHRQMLSREMLTIMLIVCIDNHLVFCDNCVCSGIWEWWPQFTHPWFVYYELFQRRSSSSTLYQCCLILKNSNHSLGGQSHWSLHAIVPWSAVVTIFHTLAKLHLHIILSVTLILFVYWE